MKIAIYTLLSVFLLTAVSCSKYKAKLTVVVTDSSNKKMDEAYVYLFEEKDARSFMMGNGTSDNSFFSGTTNSEGSITIKVKEMIPIYGFIRKSGYYDKEFFIDKPLDLKSKNKIKVILAPVVY